MKMKFKTHSSNFLTMNKCPKLNKVKENKLGLMALFMKGGGLTTNKMEKEDLFMVMVLFMKVTF